MNIELPGWVLFLVAVPFETIMAYRIRVMARAEPRRMMLLGLTIFEVAIWIIVISTLVNDLQTVYWYGAGAVIGVMASSYLKINREGGVT